VAAPPRQLQSDAPSVSEDLPLGKAQVASVLTASASATAATDNTTVVSATAAAAVAATDLAGDDVKLPPSPLSGQDDWVEISDEDTSPCTNVSL
jgi:hypothetical protein